MIERPILFSTEMANAILEGRKTQTRRIVRKQPHGAGEWVRALTSWLFPNVNPYIKLKCPYGQPGDRLWVRETWAANPWKYLGGCSYIYKSDYEKVPKNEIGTSYPQIDKWKPSIFMPREACRILLEVTDVRVERLQHISEEDALAEGVQPNCLPRISKTGSGEIFYPEGDYPTEHYERLWESINGRGSWEKNPWVWVVSFKRIEP
jgi:hypothetical protein